MGRKLVAKIYIRGKSIKCYLALDPNAYEFTKFHHRDASGKKAYELVPFKMSIRSPRSVKRTKNLIADIAINNQLAKKKI